MDRHVTHHTQDRIKQLSGGQVTKRQGAWGTECRSCTGTLPLFSINTGYVWGKPISHDSSWLSHSVPSVISSIMVSSYRHFLSPLPNRFSDTHWNYWAPQNHLKIKLLMTRSCQPLLFRSICLLVCSEVQKYFSIFHSLYTTWEKRIEAS